MASLKYGLNIKKSSQPPARAKPKKPLFGDDESDTEDAKPTDNVEEIGVFDLDNPSSLPSAPKYSAKNSGPSKPSKKPQITPYGDLSALKESRKKAEEAQSLDSSIYDYDAAYDALHARDSERKKKEKEEAALRKPKYMEGLLEAAELRKRDQLRAKEKLVAREREAEGDAFADKEKFVTDAYKKQQEEMLRLEEEEKKKEEAERKKRGPGMSGFYRSMMNEEEKRHKEATEATEKAQAVHAEAVDEEKTEKQKSDAELAKEMQEKGVDVIINDEGQVADRRQLLTAGLNVAPKPKQPAAAPASASRSAQTQHQAAQGRGSGRNAMRERQTRLIESQLEQAAKRAADQDAEERAKLEHVSKSRKTESDVSSAKERYLQRKRDAAAAAAAGKKE
ncbi:putative coiled-coil domain-containing protein 55 protein [Neofusicoccum parvum UCRNP2]|uniref:Putative coiled-coil domain-containing protein 55 protein n=1 Tax=Botryosphaeria parva (strain UCR-NP2) TaxID=1287680 RepID=R1E6N2_BOTPV|nr:putative coiled-coil domain-containing protein 55 protein [Neofusicoccum parvum UCRNP2]